LESALSVRDFERVLFNAHAQCMSVLDCCDRHTRIAEAADPVPQPNRPRHKWKITVLVENLGKQGV